MSSDAPAASMRERNVEYARKYREKNSAKIRRSMTCDCGGTFAYYNSGHHLRTKKHSQWVETQRMLNEIEELKRQLVSN